MAAPNLANISTITAKTKAAHLGTTLTTALLQNLAASGKVLKVNSIIVSNIDGSNSADVSMTYYDYTDGYEIAKTIAVPADSTLVLLDKNSVLYLEENTEIRGGASAASDLDIIISYEELS